MRGWSLQGLVVNRVLSVRIFKQFYYVFCHIVKKIKNHNRILSQVVMTLLFVKVKYVACPTLRLPNTPKYTSNLVAGYRCNYNVKACIYIEIYIEIDCRYVALARLPS